MGRPLVDINSVSSTAGGSVAIEPGAAGAGFAGLIETGPGFPIPSVELQLETPKAATSDNTRIVKARREGVNTLLLFFAFSFDILILLRASYPNLRTA